jgi:hypothetical protein
MDKIFIIEVIFNKIGTVMLIVVKILIVRVVVSQRRGKSRYG